MFIKIKYCIILAYNCARPSTPIHEVLQFKFQNDWIKRQQQSAKSKETKAKVCDTIFILFRAVERLIFLIALIARLIILITR